MRNNRMLTASKLLLTLSAATGLYWAPAPLTLAQPPSEPATATRPDPVSIYREAGAGEEQLNKIRELAKDFESSARVKAERIRNLMHQMQTLSFEPDPDEKKVFATQDEINSLAADMSNARIKLMLKIRGLLSPEQRFRLVQIMRERTGAGTIPGATPGPTSGPMPVPGTGHMP